MFVFRGVLCMDSSWARRRASLYDFFDSVDEGHSITGLEEILP